MGGKKGAKKATKKAATEEAGEDDSTQRLLNLYTKKCTDLGTAVPAKVREKFNDALNEGLFLTEVTLSVTIFIAQCMGSCWLAGCKSARRFSPRNQVRKITKHPILEVRDRG